jgi:hypothetical protein
MDWNAGILEWWSNGAMDSKPSTPILPYSTTPFRSSASEIFLSSRKTAVARDLLYSN